jgi:hypothetical protein
MLANTNCIDFSSLCENFGSALILQAKVKKPSNVLPSDPQITWYGAFRNGAKAATGASTFYDLPNRIRQAFGRLPTRKRGKLADIANVMRNDARTLFAHIGKLYDQVGRILNDHDLSAPAKRTALFHALYFLDTCHDKLVNTLITLKTYEGLVKGNAVLHYGGYIVTDKTSSTVPPPYVVKKEGEKVAEALLLHHVADERPLLQAALLCLRELEVSIDDFVNWKAENVARIDLSLNTFRGAGWVTGVAIQGLIICAINFGIGAATLNPIVFAAGAYYAVSTVMKIVEAVITTGLQNKLLRDAPSSAAQKKTIRNLETVEGVEEIHRAADGAANMAFGAVAIMAVPVTTAGPSKMNETNVGAHTELKHLERLEECTNHDYHPILLWICNSGDNVSLPICVLMWHFWSNSCISSCSK